MANSSPIESFSSTLGRKGSDIQRSVKVGINTRDWQIEFIKSRTEKFNFQKSLRAGEAEILICFLRLHC